MVPLRCKQLHLLYKTRDPE